MLASQSSGSTRISVTVSTIARAQSLTTKRSSLSKHTSTRSGRSKSLRGVSIHPSLKLNALENKNVALKSLDTTYQDLGSAVNVAAFFGLIVRHFSYKITALSRSLKGKIVNRASMGHLLYLSMAMC